MRAGEGRKHQLAAIRVARVDRHLVTSLRDLDDFIDVADVQLRINSLGEHVIGDIQKVKISGALSVPEQRAFQAVCPGQQGKLGCCRPGPAVIVRMNRQDHCLAVVQPSAGPLHAVSKHIRRRHLHRGGQIDDHGVLFCRPPCIDHRVTDLQRIIRFRSGVALRRVLQNQISVKILRALLHPCRPLQSQLLHFLPVLMEHHVALERRGRIIDVEDHVFAALHTLEGAVDLLLPALRENLEIHVVRHAVLLDQFPDKIIFNLAGCREADLNLLESQLDQQIIELDLLIDLHRINQRLIAVAQVHAAPHRRPLNLPVRPFPLRVMHHRNTLVSLIIHTHPVSSLSAETDFRQKKGLTRSPDQPLFLSDCSHSPRPLLISFTRKSMASCSSSPLQISSISSPDFTHAPRTLRTLFAFAVVF